MTVSPISGSSSLVTPSSVQASPPTAAASTAEPAMISPEEAAKEAKRKAFIEDRARIQVESDRFFFTLVWSMRVWGVGFFTVK